MANLLRDSRAMDERTSTNRHQKHPSIHGSDVAGSIQGDGIDNDQEQTIFDKFSLLLIQQTPSSQPHKFYQNWLNK